MTNRQNDSITILLGLKGYSVGRIWEKEDRVIVEVGIRGRQKCPYCGSGKLHRHGRCKAREVLHKSRLTKQAESEALWQLKERNFSQVKRQLGIGYSTLRALLERNTGLMLEFLKNKDEIYLGIDEHSFRHQELVYTVTEVKMRKMLGILKDDCIATLKEFLRKIPADKVKEVCIDMKMGLKKAIKDLFPKARVVTDPFHVIADANRRIDEARRIEQELSSRKTQIPKKIFLIGRERLSKEKREKVDALLKKYPWHLV